MAVNIVKVLQVTPAAGGPQEQILPLQNFDILRLPYHLLSGLFFYKFPCSESHFHAAVLPSLKKSLSLTLKHFLPLAGNIVLPPTASGIPVSRYAAGDSVSVAVAVSDANINHLTGNHSRDSDQFHAFLPLTLPRDDDHDGSIRFSPLAIQVTLLPDQGICISQTGNHALCDGATILSFLLAWASINKFNGAHAKFSPLYDRASVDKALATRAWNYARICSPTISSTINFPTNKVRATFFATHSQIQTLKRIALNKIPGMARVASSTVLLSGYLWSCLAKSAALVGEDVSDEDSEYLTCSADIRGRMNPPLPETYFGNCTVLVLAESTHGALKGKDGFIHGAQAIGEAIRSNKHDGVVDDLERRIKVKRNYKRVVTIAGSPRFEMYGLDYGWGSPNKFEYPTNDCDGSVFLCKARGGGGTEIIMSMSKLKMDAFAAFFHQGHQQSLQEKGKIATKF